MRTFIMKTLLAAMLLSSVPAFGQISIGVTIGEPPPPPRVIRVRPTRPAPEYIWVDSYWYPEGGSYVWHAGYWTLPPYPGAYWVQPRYDSHRFFVGYWDGPHGRFGHDHRWDRDRHRDFDRNHNWKKGRGNRGRGRG